MLDLDLLKAEITRPDQAKYLEPLRRFRGSLSSSMVAARWNFVNAMFLAEVPDLSTGAKMFAEGEVAHICGNHAKTIGSTNLGFFFNRLRMSPKVCAMVPGLHDYVSCLNRWDFDLQVCGASSPLRVKNAKVEKELRKANSNPANAFYPFVSKTHGHDCELLARIHAAVPASISGKIRGDLCQDLVVAVLAGDVRLENIEDEIPSYLKSAKHFFPRHIEDLKLKGGKIWPKDPLRADDLMPWQDLWQHGNFVDERPMAEQVSCLREKWGCSHQ